MERLEKGLNVYGYSVQDEGGFLSQWSKEKFFNRLCRNSWRVMWKKINLELYFILYIRLSDNCIRFKYKEM